jgi:hypothetical protein
MKTPNIRTLAGILVPVIAGLALTACLLPFRSRTRSQTQPTPRQSASPQTRAAEPTAGPDLTLKNVQATLASFEHLNTGDFAWLEETMDRQRKSKERIEGSIWMLRASYAGVWQPDFYSETASDEQWQAHFAKLDKWKAAYPESISARVAAAKSWAFYAWQARGEGLGASVSEENFSIFDKRIARAKKELLESRNLTRCPEWYDARLTVAIAESASRAEFDRIYNEGVKFEPTYYPLHREKATYLLPRWHGEEGEWVAFLDDASNKIGGEEGDMTYFIVAGEMLQYYWGQRASRENDISWNRIKAGYDAMQKICGSNNLYDNRFAAFAFFAEDFPTASASLIKIGDKWEKDVWRKKEIFEGARTFTAQASKAEEERIARIQGTNKKGAQNP